jgi:hypothetical protein
MDSYWRADPLMELSLSFATKVVAAELAVETLEM